MINQFIVSLDHMNPPNLTMAYKHHISLI